MTIPDCNSALPSADPFWIVAEIAHLSDGISFHVRHLSVCIIPWNGFFCAHIGSLHDSVGNIIRIFDITGGKLLWRLIAMSAVDEEKLLNPTAALR